MCAGRVARLMRMMSSVVRPDAVTMARPGGVVSPLSDQGTQPADRETKPEDQEIEPASRASRKDLDPGRCDEPRPGCVLCEIVAGRRPAHLVTGDEATVVLLDHAPLAPGHCLVAPRRHVATMPDLAADEVGPLMEWARRLAAVMPSALGADGCLVAVNVVVSQSLPHVHVHVVPRRHHDWLLAKLAARLPAQIASMVRARLWPTRASALAGGTRQDRIAACLRKALEGAARVPGAVEPQGGGAHGGEA